MSALIKYEAACRALAECKSVDEVKSWVDKAAAMQAYTRMAKDKTLEVDAAEIRIRAERRLGELLTAHKGGHGLNAGSRSQLAGKSDDGLAVVRNDRQKTAPKLADAGISKDLSSRAQKLAAVPEATFEAELAAKRERDKKDGARVSARLEKAGAKALAQQTKAAPPLAPKPEDEYTELDAARDQIEELQAMLAVANMGQGSPDDRDQAKNLIAELRAEIKTLRATLKGVTQSRDSLMNELAQVKRQCMSQQRKLKSLEAAV